MSSAEEDCFFSSDEEGDHNVENIMLCSFAHHACGPLLQGVLTRRRTVSSGSDMSLRVGCDLSLSGLNPGPFCVSSWTCG